jgi:lipopolysaccharide transport system ATP-binding protein
MNAVAITFDEVSKSFPLYHHITGGIKSFLFHLPKAIRELRSTKLQALKDVSFEVGKGQALGIIGKNGAGKSTTLGLIAGVLRPSEGRICVKGRISPLLELGAGFHPELTGRENIELNGVLMGLSRREVRTKIDEIIEFSELGEQIDQPIRTFSSGMLARLGFSVVANLEPEILLIDEILAVGDISFQERCLAKMMNFKKDGVTMVFVSHVLEDIAKLCDRVIWLDNCTIRMSGKPQQVLDAYVQDNK